MNPTVKTELDKIVRTPADTGIVTKTILLGEVPIVFITILLHAIY